MQTKEALLPVLVGPRKHRRSKECDFLRSFENPKKDVGCPVTEFQISDFELEGLKMVWNSWQAKAQAETRRKRTRLDISEAHSLS